MPQIGIACELARVPYFRDQPLALARGSIITAVSDIAGKSGVAAGMTITGARSLCRSLVVLPYNRSIYEEAAEAVWDAIATESSHVEPVSPERCFAAFDANVCLEQIEMLASLLASKIGIPIFAGVGSSKLVAEQAASKHGPDPIVRVPMGLEAVFLASVPLSQLKRVPPAVQTRLERLGVRTLGDVLRLPTEALNYQFRDVAALLRKLAVGEDGDLVRALWPPPKVRSEHAFEEETDAVQQLRLALQHCVSLISEKLQAEHSYCRTVALCVTFGDRTTQRTCERLRAATDSADEVLSSAVRLLGRLSVDRPVSVLSVEASGLGSGSATQLSLLPDTQEEHKRRTARLDEVMEYLRQKFGISAVVLGSLLAATRQVNLWTFPLGCRKREGITVATDHHLEPVRFYRRCRHETKRYDVLYLQDSWQETAWSWDRLLETSCYRVMTDPQGLHQLERLGLEWTLTATAD